MSKCDILAIREGDTHTLDGVELTIERNLRPMFLGCNSKPCRYLKGKRLFTFKIPNIPPDLVDWMQKAPFHILIEWDSSRCVREVLFFTKCQVDRTSRIDNRLTVIASSRQLLKV